MSRDVVFKEHHMSLLERKESHIVKVQENDTNIELKVEFEKSQVDPNAGLDSGEDVSSETPGDEVYDYQLVIDRKNKIIKPHVKLGYADIIAYALTIGQDPDVLEPLLTKKLSVAS